ncbi:HAMP domain-containing sensor histidine kinase [Chromobacterium sp. ATCC 53434]|uniref:hybrid sensor histidine kinase/response regulator n=1 Tax=Chromobacterium sp. (strain ATCC 53434 / SC 14030) TaxID=2059672 RepID=UPI00130529BF|nr:HAMP domain-containing sensor histidine kinase [Chromobacterium sp. ATCC 53434]
MSWSGRLAPRNLGAPERAFLALSLVATLLISWTLYAAVIKRPIPDKASDLYWMVAQTQLALNRVELDAWRYRAGQIPRREVDKSYAIAVSRYRMYSRPSYANATLAQIDGFAALRTALTGFFEAPPRAWSQQDAQQASRDIAALRPLLADFGVKARQRENSDVVQQMRMVEKHQTMYLLGLMCWLAFLCIFWFVLHRFGEVRRQATQQRQILEREQAARAALVQSELARDTFLATISHEIRSPLQSIQTCVELLEYSVPADSPGSDYLARLKLSTEHLLEQVRDIMDISALKNHQLALDPGATDVNALIQTIELAHRGNAEAKGLTLTMDCPELPVLWLDGHRLRQIVWNLLSNAIRYTDAGGITLTLGYRDRLLAIEVSDTGVGLSDEIKAQLFRPFARGKTRRPGSSGLGLAIVHELVTLFGGYIQVESEEGVGSRFSLRLPAQQASAHERDEAGQAPGRILLLDDDEHIRESYRALLEAKGYRVETLATVPAAIAKVHAENYDLLLLDLQLGNASGYEVAEAASRADANRKTPVIGMTAFKHEFNDPRQTLLAGKLEKPFSFDQLQRLLERSLPVAGRRHRAA